MMRNQGTVKHKSNQEVYVPHTIFWKATLGYTLLTMSKQEE